MEITLQVGGITCSHCVGALHKAGQLTFESHLRGFDQLWRKLCTGK